MDRTILVKELRNASPELNRKWMKKLIRLSIDSSKDTEPKGKYHLIMANEELSELMKEVSKFLRGHGNEIGIAEEMADVVISLVYIQYICGVSTEDLYKAINVKLNRLKHILNKKGIYT